MISHPFYYGAIEDRDEDGLAILRPRKYETLISKALFDKCQDVKYGRGHNRYKRTYEEYAFTGLIKCIKCGCSYKPICKENKVCIFKTSRTQKERVRPHRKHYRNSSNASN
jgi:hypothetical protein